MQTERNGNEVVVLGENRYAQKLLGVRYSLLSSRASERWRNNRSDFERGGDCCACPDSGLEYQINLG